MKQWEIWTWNFPKAGGHPAVIVSNSGMVNLGDHVNVLLCSSQRASRRAHANEVLLDESDGLDWPTLCKCETLYHAPKNELRARRGEVVEVRQSAIVQRIIAAFGWRLY